MINPPELPINDEGRNEAHIASTGVRRNGKLVMHHKISYIKHVEIWLRKSIKRP